MGLSMSAEKTSDKKDKEKQLVSSNLSYETREKIRADIRYLDLKFRDVARELRFLEKNKANGTIIRSEFLSHLSSAGLSKIIGNLDSGASYFVSVS